MRKLFNLLFIIIQQIFQRLIETLAEKVVRNSLMDLHLSVTTAENIFVEQTHKNVILKAVVEFTGVAYIFNNKNLVTFEDNFKSKGNLPFALYFDFETTAPTHNYFDPE